MSSKIIDKNYDELNLSIEDSIINLTDDITNIELTLSSPSFYKTNNTQLFYKLEPLNELVKSLDQIEKLLFKAQVFHKVILLKINYYYCVR